MTKQLAGPSVAKQIEEKFPKSVITSDTTSLVVNAQNVVEVARYLKETPELEFNYLNCVSGVDYFDYLEVVYHLTSLRHNHSLVLKVI